ncbi:BON domain-containing protein, partial [Oceanithermus sp.]
MWPFGKSAEQRLKEAFEKNPVLSRYPLTVKVVKKTAVIEGEVPKESLIHLAKIVAEGINGVQGVDTSGVKIVPQQKDASHATAEDAVALAQAALEKIKADPALTANPIDILQDGDRIIIRGAVDSEAEVEKAKALAASVPGVKEVDVSGLMVITGAAKLNVTDDDGDVV